MFQNNFLQSKCTKCIKFIFNLAIYHVRILISDDVFSLVSVFPLFYLKSWKTCQLMCENFVFLVIFDTFEVVYDWSISLLPPIILDNLFGQNIQCSESRDHISMQTLDSLLRNLVILTSDSGIIILNIQIITPDPGIITLDSGIITPDPGIITPDPGIITPDQGIITPDQGILTPDPGIIIQDHGIIIQDQGIIISGPKGKYYSQSCILSLP